MKKDYQTARGKDLLILFREKYLPELEKKYKVVGTGSKNYPVYSFKDEKMGIIDFFTVGNKCFLWKKSRWVKPGLEYIVEKLLK
jgi:hypothetical protein